jgi:uncharacterized protein
MLRASSYVIYVDLPERDDEMLLVHGYTGAYDHVSRRVATYVRSLDARRPPKPLYGFWRAETPAPNGTIDPPSDDTLRELKRRGYLTDLDASQEETFFCRIVEKLHEASSQRMPTYIVMPTYNCNLRCAYCFQDHMRSDARFHHLLRRMTPQMVDRVIGAMTRVETLHGIAPGQTRSVGFFGGEPLLASNREVVERIMTRAVEDGPARFWAVSNGTELEAYEDLLSAEHIGRIQITLDGPPDEHDRRRIYADGSGSFERIARNVTMALDKGVQINIRLNLDRRNAVRLPELIALIHEQGWPKYAKFGIYAAPLRPETEHVDKAAVFNSWDLDQMLDELRVSDPKLSIIAKPDDPVKSQARRLFADPGRNFPRYQESFCSAHTQMYIFDAFGDIYACWERTGDPSVRMGHITEDGDVAFNAPVVEVWRTRTVASNPVCRKCRYALYCGGGCAVLAEAKTGKYHMNYCDGFASRFRASIAEAYVEHEGGAVLNAGLEMVCDQ